MIVKNVHPHIHPLRVPASYVQYLGLVPVLCLCLVLALTLAARSNGRDNTASSFSSVSSSTSLNLSAAGGCGEVNLDSRRRSRRVVLKQIKTLHEVLNQIVLRSPITVNLPRLRCRHQRHQPFVPVPTAEAARNRPPRCSYPSESPPSLEAPLRRASPFDMSAVLGPPALRASTEEMRKEVASGESG